MWVLLYKPGKKIYNNSHTSSTPIDLFEIPRIFYAWIVHIHCLRTLTVYDPYKECFRKIDIISFKCLLFFFTAFNGISQPKRKTLSIEFCVVSPHAVKYKIKRTRNAQIIRLQNDINISETLCVCIYIYIYIYMFCFFLFTNPSTRAGYDTRSISKQSLIGLNSEFSFS